MEPLNLNPLTTATGNILITIGLTLQYPLNHLDRTITIYK